MKPTGINQLYQASFTQLRISSHPIHFVLAVIDCFSRYLLVLRVSSSNTTQDLATGLDAALREARQVSELGNDDVITLVTDGGPRVLHVGSQLHFKHALQPYFLHDSPFPVSGDGQAANLGAERRGNKLVGVSRPGRSSTFTGAIPPYLQLRATPPSVTVSGSS